MILLPEMSVAGAHLSLSFVYNTWDHLLAWHGRARASHYIFGRMVHSFRAVVDPLIIIMSMMPYIIETLRRLSAQGRNAFLVPPIRFICESRRTLTP